MVKRKTTRKLTGWGVRGRPFSPVEWRRSYLKMRSGNMSYSTYLAAASRLVKRKKRLN